MKQLDEKTRLIVAIIAIATVALFFGVFPMVQNLIQQAQSNTTTVVPPPPGTFDNNVPPPPPDFPPTMGGGDSETQSPINATHTYSNGKHTISGTVTTPTPCHSLSYNVQVAESYPEQVSIAFKIFPPDEPDVMCAQVMSTKTFSLSFDASEHAAIKATLDGTPITLSFE